MSFRQSALLVLVLAAAIAVFYAAPIAHLPSPRTMLAQIGIAVGVAPNPYNTLDAQLNQKQAQIDAEQADLAAREAALASTTARTAASQLSPIVWYLIAAILVLAALVGFNFYLDFHRRRKQEVAAESSKTA